jgi:FkbM family methyltransferase
VNIGQTLVKALLVFDNVHYIGFEPNPVCYNYSKQLIELNEFSNCAIVPIGIGAKDEVVQLLFFSNDTADSSASIIKDFRDEKTVVKRICTCFSWKSINAISTIKSRLDS